jgi:hypothetical protein
VFVTPNVYENPTMGLTRTGEDRSAKSPAVVASRHGGGGGHAEAASCSQGLLFWWEGGGWLTRILKSCCRVFLFDGECLHCREKEVQL